jgi:ABC-2 type transport system permease protein
MDLLFKMHLAGLRAVFAQEWRQLIYAPGTYVLQAGFLLILAICVFIVGGFFDSDFASLDMLWTFLPWLTLVLVPAFTMRAFSGEPGDQEHELIATMPLAVAEIVVGKWLAGCALLMVTLAFTFPFALTVAYLGAPDWGIIAAGYVGAALFLAVSYAIGLFASALTRERTSAYILAVALLLVVTLLGMDQASRSSGLSRALMDGLGQLSPKANLARLATGRIDLSAVANLVTVGALALWGAVEALKARRRGPNSPLVRIGYAIQGILALVVLFAVSVSLQRVDIAADLTQQRQYTLHDATIAAARAVDPGTTVDLYWSDQGASVPARIRDHAQRVERLLRTLARTSQGRLGVTTHGAAADTEAEWSAMAQGVKRVAMSSGDSFLLGAVLRQGDRRRTLDYFDVERAGTLEYDIALALTKLGQTRIPKVGLVSPLLTPSHVTEPREGLSFLRDLKKSADIAIIPFFADTLPDDLDVLIVLGGAGLKPSMLYAIDQHAMRGKGLIVCLDPLTRFNQSSDTVVPTVTGRGENIADLLAHHGVRFEASITGDALLAASIIGEDQQRTTYPFWLRVRRAQLSSAHPATASLNELLFAEPGFLTLAPSGNAVGLVSTSQHAGTMLPSAFKGASSTAVTTAFASDGAARTLAAFIPGPLVSAFPPRENWPDAHVAHRSAPAAVFVVADVDWLFDALAFEGADTAAARPLNDNHAFLANMIDLGGRDVGLLEIRSRGGADRRFSRIDQILKAARARTQGEEGDATAKIAKIEGIFAEVLKTANVQKVADLPPNIRAEFEKLNLGLIPVRRRLRDLRLEAREQVDALGRRLTLLNLAAAPTLSCAFACAMFANRRRRRASPPSDAT